LTLARVSLVVLGALLLFGLFREDLFAQAQWSPAGAFRFWTYLGGSACVLGCVAWRWPEQVLRVAAGVMLGWALWWAGPLAPLAVLFFFGSCYGLGRIVSREEADGVLATVLGAALWMTALWVALHFPVNFPLVYGVAFAIPYAFVRPPLRIPELTERREAWAAAVLLVLLGAHFLAALKPEVSADGLAMHLVLPDAVARTGMWGFDHRRDAWALMPAGADALFTGVYLMGGEAAAKLLNAGFLGLIAAMLAGAARGGRGWAVAALFVSTPLVLLVTGSLFVENVWAAFLLGATLGLLRGNIATSGMLAGAAVAVKLIAVAFVAPLTVAAIVLAGVRRWRWLGLAAVLALPPYGFAYLKSGNPVFPFANAVFRSADFDASRNFEDPRFGGARISAATPYELTFRSGKFLEGQGGAAGFQYVWLLIPGLLLARRREQWVAAAVGLAGAAVVLLAAPNLRYLYGALPLWSLVLTEAWGGAWMAALALNVWFLPVAGFYDRDFALFRKRDVAPYVERLAPAVPLIARLNREAPGEPVAFFAETSVARLEGRAYTDSWHHDGYWKTLQQAAVPDAIAAHLRALGIRRVVAPASWQAGFEVIQQFLERWLDAEPDGTAGRLTLYRLREEAREVPRDAGRLGAGTYDDRDSRIEYTGAWFHDDQFAEAAGGTLSYSNAAGAVLRFDFEGRAVTLAFTRAANRGTAEVWIDGVKVREIALRAEAVEWGFEQRLDVAPGVHRLELRVGRDGYVDLDAVRVE
jgi:hypothetical protein